MRVRPKSPRPSGKVAVNHNLLLARKALTLSKWQWFADAAICRTRDELQIMPALLVGLYLAHRAGKRLSKTEACRLMKVDRATTGPSYIARAADRGLIDIQVGSTEDRRKHLLVPTPRLIALVEAEVRRTAGLLLFLIAPRSR